MAFPNPLVLSSAFRNCIEWYWMKKWREWQSAHPPKHHQIRMPPNWAWHCRWSLRWTSPWHQAGDSKDCLSTLKRAPTLMQLQGQIKCTCIWLYLTFACSFCSAPNLKILLNMFLLTAPSPFFPSFSLSLLHLILYPSKTALGSPNSQVQAQAVLGLLVLLQIHTWSLHHGVPYDIMITSCWCRNSAFTSWDVENPGSME